MKLTRMSLPVLVVSALFFSSLACGADNNTWPINGEQKNNMTNDAKSDSSQAEGPSELDMAVLAEINLARSNPKNYAETYIAPLSGRFSAEYFNECIEEMKALKPMLDYSFSPALWRMAKEHADTQGPTGKTGHDRTDGRTFQNALGDYCSSFISAGENISYGYNTARDIVIQLLVDDGVTTRGHRKNILNSGYTQAGAAVSTHSVYRHMCVIDFANGCVDKN